MHKAWSDAVKTRDNGLCVICGAPGTNAHHIYCDGYFPDMRNDIANGVTLCRACHVLTHRGKFGATAKGKYPQSVAIAKLSARAFSDSVLPLIATLVSADVEASEFAKKSKKFTKTP